MDIISNIENIGSIDSVGLDVDSFPEESIYNEITRIHIIFFMISLVLTMFLVLL